MKRSSFPCAVGMAALFLSGAMRSAAAAGPVAEVASPDGGASLQVFSDQGQLRFAVQLDGRTVIEPSPLHFSIDGVDLAAGAQPGKAKKYSVNETYPWRGVHAVAVDHGNGARVAFRQGATDFTLEMRAYDDAVAFRFIAPGAAGVLRTPEESSKFTLPAGSRVWYHGNEGHYEGSYTNQVVGEIPSGKMAMPPVTFKLPSGGYASLTEAALADYSGAAFAADGTNGFNLILADQQPVAGTFRRQHSNDVARLSLPARIAGTITTPWRVVILGTNLDALVNCDVVNDLNPPPARRYFWRGIKTSWLKPGRALWTYLDGGDRSLAGQKEVCRLAAELGFEYDIIEGYWNEWSDAEIRTFAAEAKREGVGLWFWRNSSDLRTPEAQEKFFKRLHDLGVVGAKIDFFDHEHKEIVDQYQSLLKCSAKYHVLVNFHGANKPTGEIRTWPNELTREAVRGMETRRITDRATHDTTLPFTRFLAGPADYTPMLFDDRERRQNTTWAHQIATAAVFTMPLLTYAANPKNILANPAAEIIRSIPATWDETIVLPPSEIGECAAFARRSGRTWFVAVVNGKAPRKFSVPLTFLREGDYQALIAEDSPEGATSVNVRQAAVGHDDALAIDLQAGGGFVARLTRK